MTVPLVVILGAGASLAAGEWTDRSTLPPLTTDLFRESRYGDILNQYELAHQAGRYVMSQLEKDAPPAFEALLRALRESPHAHHRHMSLAVPFYLQELLLKVSEKHYAQAHHYDRLIERLLTLDCVFFVTLNYDVLLDRRLHAHHQLLSAEDYVFSSRQKNWSLLKPHGSVNWYRSLRTSIDVYAPPHAIEFDQQGLGFEPPTASLQQIRANTNVTGVPHLAPRYPALALPEGPDDQILMPDRHTRFFEDGVRSVAEIDLLVVGYSGYDKEVLTLLDRSLTSGQTRLRRTTVVNRDHASAHEVNLRLEEAGLVPIWNDVRAEDFSQWVDGGRLDYLVDNYGDGPSYY